MRLIRSAEKGAEQTEALDQAARMVDDALMRGQTIDGMDQFGTLSEITHHDDIVEAVRNGDFLLGEAGARQFRRRFPASTDG